jgi:phage N-6-adenine-methyltransferase
MTHVKHNSGVNDDWYTPEYIIDMVRQVMPIELDPASSDSANKIVKSKRYFTEANDGLLKNWKGKVYMNPPYSRGWVKKFMEKLCYEYKAGFVDEAIALLNNGTETGWFQDSAKLSSAICFPKGRIRYLSKDLNSSNGPLQGQVIFYFGKNYKKFIKVFQELGECFRK